MLRFGLLGCGHIAHRHADLLGHGRIADATLTAVCDVLPERAAAFGERHGVASCTSIADLLARDDVDVVAILTPSGLHHEHCLAAAAAGKHVVVEKPMALRLDHADAMIQACEQAGVRLFVVKQCRFHRPVRHVKDAVDKGHFGKLVLGSVRLWWRRDQAYYESAAWRGTWALDGGVLMNQAIHHVDLLQWLMGPVTELQAFGTRALLDMEAEDTAVASLRFASGAVATIEASVATRPKGIEGSVSLLGSGGTVTIGGMAADRLDLWALEGAEPPSEDFTSAPAGVENSGHKAYYDHVVRCLSGGAEEAVDGHAGRRSLAVVTALYEAMERNRPVALETATWHSRLGRS